MRISINVGLGLAGPQTVDDLVAEAGEVADAGFAGAWWPQLPYADGLAPWDALTTVAVAGRAVPRIELGTAIVVTYPHHPLALAGQALTAQAATGNRLTLGLGVSHRAIVEGAFGASYDRPARHLREYLTALLPALRGEPVDHHGEALTAVGQVRLTGAEPPGVVLAALGPAMLRLAGELTDGTVTTWTGPAALAERVVPAITRAAEGAGRSAPRVIANLPACVTSDEEGARAFVAERFAGAGHLPSYRAMLDAEGTSVGDVVAAGDEAAVAAHVARLADAGATEFLASPFGSPQERKRTLALLASLT